MKVRITWGVCVVWLGIFAVGVATRAEDFRVETSLFVDKEKAKPQSTNLTLFSAGRVYDFFTRDVGNQNQTQVGIYDPLKGHFILLDTVRKVKTELDREDLLQRMGALMVWAANSNDPLLKFSATPQFKEEAGTTEQEFRYSSPQLTYRVLTYSPESDEVSKQYREFTDAFARLNTLLNPGSRPPSPRLAVNESLAKKNLVPVEVELTIPPHKTLDKPLVVRTVHDFQWKISATDMKQIERAGTWINDFKKVDFDEYVSPGNRQANAPQQNKSKN